MEQLPGLQDQVKSLSAENETLASNYNSERVLRKKYYNMVEDMKGKRMAPKILFLELDAFNYPPKTG